MKCGTGQKTSPAFRDVAVMPEVSQVYALSVAPTADRFRLLLPECKQVTLSERAASTLRPPHGV